MTPDQRDLRADLIELATVHTDDPVDAVVALLGATLAMSDLLVEYGMTRGSVRMALDALFAHHAN